jgi:arsenate reductase
MIRTQEPLFKNLKLENAAEDDLRCAVVDNPALLQRPILVKDDRGAIGRPPENVLSIL